MVGKGENAEYNLHGIVRTSEYARQQQQRKVYCISTNYYL